MLMSKYVLLTTLLLTSCQSKVDQRIYQPALLLLPPLTEVQTTEGVYTSSDSIERWYPAKKVEDLEAKLSNF